MKIRYTEKGIIIQYFEDGQEYELCSQRAQKEIEVLVAEIMHRMVFDPHTELYAESKSKHTARKNLNKAIEKGDALIQNAIVNRDIFLAHTMKAFPFEESRDAGVYYDADLNAEMAVAGNDVSIQFQNDADENSGKK